MFLSTPSPNGAEPLPWNQAAEDMYGWTAAQVLGRPASEVLRPEPPGLAGRERREMARQLAASGQYRGEAQQLRKDGSTIEVEASTFATKDAEGRTNGYVIVTRDITERRGVELALQESESRFRQLAESLPQLVWTSQPDGRWDYLGPQWVAYTGVHQAQQLGYGWIEQIHPDDRGPMMTAWFSTVATGKPLQLTLRVRHHTGDYRRFDTRATALRDAAGQVVRWFGMCAETISSPPVESAECEVAGPGSAPDGDPHAQ